MLTPVYTTGLIGFPLTHSFSHRYFREKFDREQLHNFDFLNFQLHRINELPDMIKNTPTLIGFSVTIPHKETVMPFLNEISSEAKEIGAVNAVKVEKRNDKPYLIGYNTDVYGFSESLKKNMSENIKSALILGTGGAAKAVHYALKQLGILSYFVTRDKENKNFNCILYSELNQNFIKNNLLIVNATPLGMFPKVEECPAIPYNFLTEHHLLFDLTYNPATTKFLEKGKNYGTKIVNGYEMLVLQAEKAWDIFTQDIRIKSKKYD